MESNTHPQWVPEQPRALCMQPCIACMVMLPLPPALGGVAGCANHHAKMSAKLRFILCESKPGEAGRNQSRSPPDRPAAVPGHPKPPHGGVPDGCHSSAARHGCCGSACRQQRCGIIILPALWVLKTILEVIPFDLMLIPDNCFQA